MKQKGWTYRDLHHSRKLLLRGHPLSANRKEILHHYYVSRPIYISDLLARETTGNMGRELAKAFKQGIIDPREFSDIMKAYTKRKGQLQPDPENPKDKPSPFSLIEIDA